MKNYSITVNGHTYQVQVEELGSAAPVAVSPAAPIPAAPVASAPATPAAPAVKAPAGTAGSVKVAAPMPGKILGVKASVGQSVKAGDTIVILEAMKMENEIVAPSDGVVASVDVSTGDAVEAGQVLATLN